MNGATLRIIACGPGTSLQDAGRRGVLRSGVSPAGAMDIEALAIANALVGNPPDAAALEFALAGGVFVVEGASVLVALAGAEAVLRIGDRLVPPLMSAIAAIGETIAVGPMRGGLYAYLALAGGLATEAEFGSRSQHRRSGIGGALPGAGTALPVGRLDRLPMPLRLAELPWRDEGPIRVMPGPQAEFFTEEAQDRLVSAEYRVSLAADRMGVKLDGPALAHARGFNIVSDGIAAGSIQVPGDGRPIVLLKDRQTTGGYPKIATVISADLGRFAQIPPGGTVRFAAVTREEAVKAAKASAARLAALSKQLVSAAATINSETLLRANLISGVTGG